MEKYAPRKFVERIETVMKGMPVFPVPRGELWLGSSFLRQAGLNDTLENHFRMAERLGQDMVCVSVADDTVEKPALGYRYFQCRDLGHAVRFSNRFVAAVIDGPFQEIVNGMGLMTVLKGMAFNREEIIRAYETQKQKTLDMILRCLEQGSHAVVIADDLAADQGPLINPADIGRICTSFYREAVTEIHKSGAYAFLHSCGNISRLAALIRDWNFDGLAAVQHRVNDLLSLRENIGPHLVFMAGIDAEWIGAELPSAADLSEFKRIIRLMASVGGLILCSSCGLYEGAFLDRIKAFYNIADSV